MESEVQLPHVKYGICAIASPLEANYLSEWIAYHKKIGIERFFICTNGWSLKSTDPAIVTTRLDGRQKQLMWYTWFAQNMSKYVDYCAFIDCDEFIKLGAKHKSFADLAEEHRTEDAFCLSWRLFGSSGLHFDWEYSVLKRFTHRQKGFNQHVKCILNLAQLRSFKDDKRVVFTNPHFAIFRDKRWPHDGVHTYTVDGREIFGPYDTAAETRLNDDSPWLAHFFCKTPEEWTKKREQGRIDVPPNSPLLHRNDSEFAEHDLNDVEDTRLRDVL